MVCWKKQRHSYINLPTFVKIDNSLSSISRESVDVVYDSEFEKIRAEIPLLEETLTFWL